MLFLVYLSCPVLRTVREGRPLGSFAQQLNKQFLRTKSHWAASGWGSLSGIFLWMAFSPPPPPRAKRVSSTRSSPPKHCSCTLSSRVGSFSPVHNRDALFFPECSASALEIGGCYPWLWPPSSLAFSLLFKGTLSWLTFLFMNPFCLHCWVSFLFPDWPLTNTTLQRIAWGLEGYNPDLLWLCILNTVSLPSSTHLWHRPLYDTFILQGDIFSIPLCHNAWWDSVVGNRNIVGSYHSTNVAVRSL